MEPRRVCMNNEKDIDSLPDEILINILQRIGCNPPLPQSRNSPPSNLSRPHHSRPPSRYLWRHLRRIPDRQHTATVTSTVLSALVCKRWRALANHAVLTLSFANHDASDEFSAIANRFPNLRSLRFHNVFFPSASFPRRLVRAIPALQTLDLDRCRCKDGEAFVISLMASLPLWKSLQTLLLGRLLNGVDHATVLTFLNRVCSAPSLEEFRFALNDCDDILGEVGEAVGEMSQLRSLGLGVQDLWHGNFSSRLTSLVNLSIDDASPCLEDLTEETEFFEGLSNVPLETLRIGNTCVDEDVVQHLRYLPRLRAFKLEDVGYWNGCFHKGLGELTNLEELDFSSLHVMDEGDGRLIPESVRSLKRLRVMRIMDCADVACVPEGLGFLEELRELWLDDCVSLRELPESVGGLSKLQVLSLRGCRSLVSIPNSISKMASLRELHLSGGVSSPTLSQVLGSLHQLRVLALVGCYGLDALPESIGHLLKLRELTLEDCAALRLLPDNLGQLSPLRVLRVRRCPSLERLPNSLGTQKFSEVELTDCIALHDFPRALLQSMQIQSFKLLQRINV